MMRTVAIFIALLLLSDPWERAARQGEAGDYAGAEQEYRALLAERPDDPDVHYNLGTALLWQGRHDEARGHLEQAREVNSPEIALATLYNLGNTDLEPAQADRALPDRERRLRRAVDAYRQTLLADPNDEDAKWNLELAQRLLDEAQPPTGGGGGGGGGGALRPGEPQGGPAPAAGAAGASAADRARAETLLRTARQEELDVQRTRLRKPQPPGPIRP